MPIELGGRLEVALAVAVPEPAPVVPRLHRANRVLDWRKDRTFWKGLAVRIEFWGGFCSLGLERS